jgi:hypothetical protein
MAGPADLQGSPLAQQLGRSCGHTPVYQDKLQPLGLAMVAQHVEQGLCGDVLMGRGWQHSGGQGLGQ